MRPIYVCIGCAATYLPPENPSSGPAPSPAHCSRPDCQAAAREAVEWSGLSEAKLGELARRAAGLEDEPRRPRARRRASTGRRAGSSPAGGRGKLR
ncbi:hypothetical protein ABZ760_25495 [Streptomyces sp. NPDC006658]|uniref:hypothetical protein n=1 Tax=unclassified Streptomyces TaxID=2593676 RepID=UPI0029660B62|nr:hypothetical protein [Streptomyces sp. SCL15-4]